MNIREETLKIARNLMEKDPSLTGWVISKFPELKESKGERIKCAAIEFVRQNKSFSYYLGISKEEVIAWLEKQGEQKKTPIEEEFPYDNPSDTLEGEIENIWGKLSSGGRFSATKEGFAEVSAHFANWQKEQMMKKAILGSISQDGGIFVDSDYLEGYDEFDIVKVLIIKED